MSFKFFFLGFFNASIMFYRISLKVVIVVVLLVSLDTRN